LVAARANLRDMLSFFFLIRVEVTKVATWLIKLAIWKHLNHKWLLIIDLLQIESPQSSILNSLSIRLSQLLLEENRHVFELFEIDLFSVEGARLRKALDDLSSKSEFAVLRSSSEQFIELNKFVGKDAFLDI
jgi:hypothetical protein